MMEERVAIIDMGTNTFLLLIAEKRKGRYETLYQQRIASKIGMGGINGGVITPEAIGRAMAALREFKKMMDDWKVTRSIAIGTSAIRSANNGQELIKKIKAETGIEAKIISGDEEAEWIYLGVRQAVPLGLDKSLIVDIGGGSVEFIIANQDEIFWKQSFEIGGQRLMEKFQHHDPILPQEVELIDRFLTDSLHPLFIALIRLQPQTMVGSSGSFDTLSEIYCTQMGIDYKNQLETPLTILAFDQIHQELLQKNRADRLTIPGMIELRVDMIVVGSIIVHLLLSKYSFRAIRVSSYSLKEGVLARL